jgi:hypothetical protein
MNYPYVCVSACVRANVVLTAIKGNRLLSASQQHLYFKVIRTLLRRETFRIPLSSASESERESNARKSRAVE